ncbi:beta-galactosidase [Microlunatus sp. Gsoil 973]|uniref:beta-galactosidase n=1 Tax=Microlunatus sp. Gsoil 973 TaxID=2672569 RepID=UPI0018A85214|nr:beta-galactosidase [Microlunatus sp. Gsoil 973]
MNEKPAIYQGFPYGAVYFRKTNPPAADWERDYAVAREDGFTSFRHWFMWAGIEVAPGEFEWDDYDRQLDLAAWNGLTTIIAEHVTIAPEWLFLTYPDSRYERRDGSKIDSQMQVSSSIGGTPGLCLDNDDVRAAAGRFLTELVTRYRNHPGTGGYDVWNETNIDPDVCYCPATQAHFREWLRKRYGDDVSILRTRWGRYYSAWEQVQAPRTLGLYGQSIDWLLFRRDRAHELLRWRVQLIRSLDQDHPITAHGVAGTLGFGIEKGIDDWMAAAEVDSFGFTFVASRRSDRRWKQALAVELVRSASDGKPFWHSEMQAGPLWLQPQVVGRPLDDGRVSTPDDIRYWNLMSMAGGVNGIYHLRWRPLIDGPLFQAFGAYDLDGSRTDRSRQVSAIARWAAETEQQQLWAARAAPAPLSLLFVPESQAYGLIARHSRKPYERAISGAWRALYDLSVVADLRKLHQLAGTEVAYLPCPTLLPDEWARALIEWVRAGGTLISEATPAWFNDHAHAATRRPGAGLDELFGATEFDVEFTPEILDDVQFRSGGHRAYGGEIRQRLTPTTGVPTGWYDDGSVAVVDHEFGAGRTRLIGTMPGTGYSTHQDSGTRGFYQSVLDWAGVRPQARAHDDRLVTRLHVGDAADFLWVINSSREDVESMVELFGERSFNKEMRVLWGSSDQLELSETDTTRVRIPARDGLVIRIGR